MAEPLKNFFNEGAVRHIASTLHRAWPKFQGKKFEKLALDGLSEHALLGRGNHIMQAMHATLPDDYPAAVAIIVRSLPPAESRLSGGMNSFIYLPHTMFISTYGLEHFDVSMQAQYELTQRFTAEFSIRPFINRYPAQTLAVFQSWSRDPSHHVRRLVSEGTRPRLPWATRLQVFREDPRPVLQLLEVLRDDPEEYVRRSVANHLNDLSKEHPALLYQTCKRWLADAPVTRKRLIQHALRTAIKRGEPEALTLLGFGQQADVEASIDLSPRLVKRGGSLKAQITVSSATKQKTEQKASQKPQQLALDLAVHFVKANGERKAKVFKGVTLTLSPEQVACFQKTISFADLTTRKHYPGTHRIEVIANGKVIAATDFEVR